MWGLADWLGQDQLRDVIIGYNAADLDTPTRVRARTNKHVCMRARNAQTTAEIATALI